MSEWGARGRGTSISAVSLTVTKLCRPKLCVCQNNRPKYCRSSTSHRYEIRNWIYFQTNLIRASGFGLFGIRRYLESGFFFFLSSFLFSNIFYLAGTREHLRDDTVFRVFRVRYEIQNIQISYRFRKFRRGIQFAGTST